MKKLLNLAFGYAIAAIVCGVFYREYTKYLSFTGRTTLAFAHVHLFVLGMVVFLLLYQFSLQMNFEKSRKFKIFFILYNIGLPFMVIMLLVRGVVQAAGITLGNSGDAAMSGITGIAHIIMTIAFVFMFLTLKEGAAEKSK